MTAAKTQVAVLTASILVCLSLRQAPATTTAALRQTLRDVLRPGAECVSRLPWPVSVAQPATLVKADEAAQATDRTARYWQERAMAAEARLAARAEFAVEETPALFQADRVTARVIGRELAEAWRRGRVLNRGSHDRVREEAVVVKSTSPLVDVGRDYALEAADWVTSGGQLLGKIQQVGRWTSTWIPVTDPRFRMTAVLVAPESTNGTVYRCLVKGMGEQGCVVTGLGAEVPPWEALLGYSVYAVEDSTGQEQRFWLGEVADVQVAANGQPQLPVRVTTEPQANEVEVVRLQLNTYRLAEQRLP